MQPSRDWGGVVVGELWHDPPVLASPPASVVAVAVLVLMHIAARPAAADCIGLETREMKRISARVLEGTVLRLDQDAVTIAVHRVWKGAVASEVILHLPRTAEDPRLNMGQRLVFFAYLQTADDRRTLYGLSDDSPPSFSSGAWEQSLRTKK